MIASLIGGAIAILVGAALLGPAANEIYAASYYYNGSEWLSTNVTGWASTVTSLTTGFFALSLMGVGVACLYAVLRQAGVF